MSSRKRRALAKPNRFFRAHRRMMRAHERLLRKEFRSTPDPAGNAISVIWQNRTMIGWIAQLRAEAHSRSVLQSHLFTYASREGQSRRSSHERKLLHVAARDVDRLLETHPNRSWGIVLRHPLLSPLLTVVLPFALSAAAALVLDATSNAFFVAAGMYAVAAVSVLQLIPAGRIVRNAAEVTVDRAAERLCLVVGKPNAARTYSANRTDRIAAILAFALAGAALVLGVLLAGSPESMMPMSEP